MSKNIIFYWVMIIILTGLIIAEETDQEAIEMPEGFEGVRLGMSLEEFLKVRPKVRSSEFNLDGPGPFYKEVDPKKRDQMVEETIEHHSFFFEIALYTFEDGNLSGLLTAGPVLKKFSQDMKAFRKRCPAFLTSCIKRWGNDFQKKIVRGERIIVEYLAPLLWWEKGSTRIAVVCVPDFKDSNISLDPLGVLQVTISSQPKLDLGYGFKEEQNQINDETCDELFAMIGITSDIGPDKKTDKGTIEMPDGFENVRLGMSLKEFSETTRPFLARLAVPVRLDKPDQRHDEIVRGDPVFESGPLFTRAVYDFKEGKLGSFTVATQVVRGEFTKERQAFLASCIQKWGTSFDKKVVRGKLGINYPTPLLLWEKGQFKIAATCTPEFGNGRISPICGNFEVRIDTLKKWSEMFSYSEKMQEVSVEQETRDELFQRIGLSSDSKEEPPK